MNPSTIVYGGFGLAIAVLYGLYSWEGMKAERAKLEADGARRSLSMAEVELKDAAATAEHNREVAESFKAEAIRQRNIAAEADKKSRQRLDAFNALNRKLNNVPSDQNTPVSPHLELLLDELRSAVPGSGSAPSGADESGNVQPADPVRRDVSTEARPAAEATGP